MTAHAEWCNVNLDCFNSSALCDCGGNEGRCPACGALGPCGFADDGTPLICSPEATRP